VDLRHPKPSPNLKPPPLCITCIVDLRYIVVVVSGLVMVLGITTTTMYRMHTLLLPHVCMWYIVLVILGSVMILGIPTLNYRF
jgi:hypothetical protein